MYQFSISDHACFLEGYLDAMSRYLTTDSLFYGLSLQLVEDDAPLSKILCAQIHELNPIENWSSEFGSVVEDLLGQNQRERLFFYFIDYIDWFKEFTEYAKCSKMECEPLFSDTLDQRIYLIEFQENQNLLISLFVSSKQRTDINPLSRSRTDI